MNAEQEHVEFAGKTAEWDDARLNAWLARRQQFLSETICVPRDGQYRNAFIREPYASMMRNSFNKDMDAIFGKPPASLINPNPFTQSPYRKKGLAAWDAALEIANPKLREKDLIDVRQVQSIKTQNHTWIDKIHPAMQRVGPLGPNGTMVRPAGAYIYDLKAMSHGRAILEAAHVLTHQHMDKILADKKPSRGSPFPCAAMFRRIITELIVAIHCHLPLNIKGLTNRKDDQSLLPFGLSVAPTIYIQTPTMLVPFEGSGRPEIDGTLAVVDVGMLIEPQPAAFAHGFPITAADCWCCMPSLFVIAGWETIDVISHWNLATYDVEKKDPVLMTMHVCDLLPPDELWAYLALGYQKRGLPSHDDGWLYFDEWLSSDAYVQAYMTTPPLPCQLCMNINKESDCHPLRPKHYPRERYGRKDKDWVQFRGDIKKLHKIVEQATILFEGKRLKGPHEAKRIRTERQRRYNARMEELKDRAWYAKANERGYMHLTVLQERKFKKLREKYPDLKHGGSR